MATAAPADAPFPLDAPPSYSLSSSTHMPDRDDVDTCRICRGETTPEEPLFFPCKCSGSIKYVHQECLMEWLSHSQKKYCELCKTSFRFTKLYHPGMPNNIPTSVFLRRAAVHIVKLFMTWCRAILVVSVWLLLLPWCMRIIWRSLFWVGDGGWNQDDWMEIRASRNRTRMPSVYDLDAVHTAVQAAQDANRSAQLPVPNLFTPYAYANGTVPNSTTAWDVARRFFFGLTHPLHTLVTPASNVNTTIIQLNATVDHLGRPRNPSLLSGVSFFHWFPSKAANRFVIDVLEGQIITLAVVVTFILIFLIREWVVQQQPVINMVAMGEDAPAVPAEQADEIVEPEDEPEDAVEEEHAEEVEDPVDEAEAAEDPSIFREDIDDEDFTAASPSPHARLVVRNALQMWRETGEVLPTLDAKVDALLAKTATHEDIEEDTVWIIQQLPHDLADQALQNGRARLDVDALPRGRIHPDRSSSLVYSASIEQTRPTESHAPSTSPSGRPNMPARGQSSIATEIRRHLEEDHPWSFANVPRPVEAAAESAAAANVPDSWEDEDAKETPGPKLWIDQEQGSDYSSESWQQVPDIVVENSDQESSEVKGKSKAKVFDARAEEAANRITSSDPAADLLDVDQASNEKVLEGSEAATNLSISGSESNQPTVESEADEAAREGPAASQQDQEPESATLEAAPAPAPIAGAEPQRGLLDRILDWMFDGVAPGVQAAEDGANDEHIVRNLADEPPFVALEGNDPRDPADAPVQDPEVAAAAAQAGIDNDQDAIDDAEDLEGIMELIGMQGPLTGLFQNAMFSAVLISATLACAVWLPYLYGKIVILFVGSPIALFVKLPLQVVATLADFLVDGALLVAAGLVYGLLNGAQWFIHFCCFGVLDGTVAYSMSLVSGPAKVIAVSAAERLGKLMLESPLVPPPTYSQLSINSHTALRTIQNATTHTLNQTSNAVTTLLEDASTSSTFGMVFSALCTLPHAVQVCFITIYSKIASFTWWLVSTRSYKVTFDLDVGGQNNTTPEFADQWTATDRTIAILAGYAAVALAGAIYLRRGVPISSSRQGQRIERIFTEGLQQAGGVLKVILIISIEMLVFPLYCGLLLDMALLPLFGGANMYTRWQFTRNSPWTSGFVHWFIGTCYMFHFALFVAMCRKIMRRGVLYFIRDPDDPQYHPVRDVLERSVTTQLRKIAFSALVYGALVIICLGGVVWGLSQVTSSVLPIQWVSHAPSLELPLDMLFYNFLTPVIIKLYKPSDGLHTISKWWFKRCARVLRLSDFLFGEKDAKQEGRRDNGEIINGRLVRAPASDQVRIAKGDPVFVDVDSKNNRKDGRADVGVHSSDLVSVVYIPPWFRVRLGIFVFTIWMFAAVAGVSATIIPLVFGRYLFSLILPSDVEMNDIHAFSLGVYSLGSVIYTAYRAYNFLQRVDGPAISSTMLFNALTTVSNLSLRALRFAYVWTTIILLIPFLFAILIELYALMPLHAYLGPAEPHVVHLIQDWTLGFLYARLVARFIFSDRASRPARAFAAVTQKGYLDPNAQIATRCFLLPALSLFTFAIAVPSAFAVATNILLARDAGAVAQNLVWRFSYPAVGCAVALVWAARECLGVVRRWRLIVRDEVYLIGERLHNFGERRARVLMERRNTVAEGEAAEREPLLGDVR